MPEVIWSSWKPEKTHATHSGVKTHTCSECGESFSLTHHLRMHIAHGHPHWGGSSQMCRMWRFIWWGWAPGTTHAHSQWGEATQVHTMRLCMSTGNHSKKAHQNTFFTKAIQINANGATSLQWQDSISTNIYSTTAEKNHMTIVGVGVHSLKHNIWKATSAFTYQCTKCSFSSAQSSNLKKHMIRHSTAVD